MSVRINRSRHRRQAVPVDHAQCGASLTPLQRITVFTVILLVVIILVCSGQPACDVIGLLAAAGAAATQIGPWLSGQRPALGSAGGA
ncbi:hypothetical protein [Streptomyces sp. NRRL S-1022]|uniref:hypothetical protein n=1 Tax=Streptomyces sp. NRRL S-1022 TaxID=1463880 RepID=UPI0004BF0C2C|nr:hypothetical protein [Streptomyces sp. NRRL S-1022]